MRNQTIPAHHRRAVANAWASDATNMWSAWCRFLFSNLVTAFLLFIDIKAPACRKFLFSQEFHGRGANRCAPTNLLCVQGLEGDYLWCKMTFFWLPSIACISLSLLLAQQELGVMGFLPFKTDGRRHFVSGSQEGIDEMTVVISPFLLTRPYYWYRMWCPDWVTWWRSTSAHHFTNVWVSTAHQAPSHSTNEHQTWEFV